ncbi:MAG TPA: hypothetical protein VGF56_14040 [Rhizomicrobium sp.]|jgi:hypothetical protein
MWTTISLIVIAVLAGAALYGIGSSIYSAHVLARFRRDPSCMSIDEVCRHIDKEGVSFFFLAASCGLIGVILALPAFSHRYGLEFIGFVGVICAVAGFFLKVPLDWIFGPSRRRAPLESLPPNGGGRLPYFAAAFPPGKDKDADTFDTYKIFIAPTMLCAAEVEDNVEVDGTLIKPKVSIPDTEAMFYDAFDVTSPDFHRLNSRNFQYAWRDVASLSCDPGFTPVVDALNSGKLALHMKSGKKHEFIVLGRRDMAALQAQLQSRLKEAAGAEQPHVLGEGAAAP